MVMDNHELTRANLWAIAKVLSYKIWFAAFVVCATVSIFALRHNNQTMLGFRNQLYAADKSGIGVEKALDNLRSYVYGHMNTDLTSGGNSIYPPIQLEYTYQRLEQKAQAAANNQGLYTTAENYCEAKIPSLYYLELLPRVTCVENYITTHGGHAPAKIPPALYEYDFLSPVWSPDLAGWSLVVSGLLLALSVASFAKQKYL